VKKIFGKFYVKVAIGILVIALLATPTTLYFIDKHKTNESLKLATIQSSFIVQNPNTTILDMAKQTEVYLASWSDEESQGISVLFGGVWVKIYSQPIQNTTSVPSTTTAPIPEENESP
jgi:hypothetical protein